MTGKHTVSRCDRADPASLVVTIGGEAATNVDRFVRWLVYITCPKQPDEASRKGIAPRDAFKCVLHRAIGQQLVPTTALQLKVGGRRLIQLHGILIDHTEFHGGFSGLELFNQPPGITIVNMFKVQASIERDKDVLLLINVPKIRQAVVPGTVLGQFGNVASMIVDDDRLDPISFHAVVMAFRNSERHGFIR